jgi:multiple sugar transport system substrate-binding protein
MKKVLIMTILVCFLSPLVLFAQGAQDTETVEIVYWSQECADNPFFENFWVEAGSRFNEAHPEVNFSIKLECIPFEGYEARYMSAFTSGQGPDVFSGETHVWEGEFGSVEPFPADLAAKVEELVLPVSREYGFYDGVRYGIPREGGNFMMMYINEDLYKEAGLDPNKPPKTYTEMLEHAKKLTKYDENGEVVQAGFAIRFAGHPFGIADKLAPFYHAWGARFLNWEERKATGYFDSPEGIAAMKFYTDLVQEEKVATVKIDSPESLFAQGLAGIFFREAWYEGWLDNNSPDINYRVYALPVQNDVSGFSNNFPFAIQVNKNASDKNKEWIWKFFDWYLDNPEVRLEHYIGANNISTWKDIADDPVFTKLKVYDAWKEMGEGRVAPTYFVPCSQEVLSIIGDVTLQIMHGSADAETAVKNAAKEIDTVLQRY